MFSKGPKFVLQKGPKSQMPPLGNLIKNIPDIEVKPALIQAGNPCPGVAY